MLFTLELILMVIQQILRRKWCCSTGWYSRSGDDPGLHRVWNRHPCAGRRSPQPVLQSHAALSATHPSRLPFGRPTIASTTISHNLPKPRRGRSGQITLFHWQEKEVSIPTSQDWTTGIIGSQNREGRGDAWWICHHGRRRIPATTASQISSQWWAPWLHRWGEAY